MIVWRHGTATDLGPGNPVAISRSGEVIGSRRAAPGEFHAFLWRNGTMTDLGTLGGASSFPSAISDRGQVVGVSTDARGVYHGFVWQNGTMTLLPTPARYGNLRTRAVAINDHDQIVGDNCYADCELRAPWAGSRFAVLWTLTPHGIKTQQILGRR